jgi:hypothetical protein
VSSTGTDGKQSTGDITVPADALLGATRMRVIKKFSTVPDACNAAGYGQAEDYTVVVDAIRRRSRVRTSRRSRSR